MTAEVASLIVAWLGASVHAFAGSMLLYTGIVKLRSGGEFEAILAAYRLLPLAALPHAARLLPGAEIVLGAGLFVPVSARWCAAPAAGLLVLFALAVAINLARGRKNLDCGCGFGAVIGWDLAAGNGFLAAALLASLSAPAASDLTWAAGTVLGVTLLLLRLVATTIGSVSRPRSSFEPRQRRL